MTIRMFALMKITRLAEWLIWIAIMRLMPSGPVRAVWMTHIHEAVVELAEMHRGKGGAK